jgi:hypothetical protein
MGFAIMGMVDPQKSEPITASPLTTFTCKDHTCCLEIAKNTQGTFVDKRIDGLITTANGRGRDIFVKIVGNGYRIVVY